MFAESCVSFGRRTRRQLIAVSAPRSSRIGSTVGRLGKITAIHSQNPCRSKPARSLHVRPLRHQKGQVAARDVFLRCWPSRDYNLLSVFPPPPPAAVLPTAFRLQCLNVWCQTPNRLLATAKRSMSHVTNCRDSSQIRTEACNDLVGREIRMNAEQNAFIRYMTRVDKKCSLIVRSLVLGISHQVNVKLEAHERSNHGVSTPIVPMRKRLESAKMSHRQNAVYREDLRLHAIQQVRPLVVQCPPSEPTRNRLTRPPSPHPESRGSVSCPNT